jgi:hypothetical protein
MDALIGRARFAAKAQKYFMVNEPIGDYLIYLS